MSIVKVITLRVYLNIKIEGIWYITYKTNNIYKIRLILLRFSLVSKGFYIWYSTIHSMGFRDVQWFSNTRIYFKCLPLIIQGYSLWGPQNLRVVPVDGLAVLEPLDGLVVRVGGLTFQHQCSCLSLFLVLQLLEELNVSCKRGNSYAYHTSQMKSNLPFQQDLSIITI